jgi:hypothetical protein
MLFRTKNKSPTRTSRASLADNAYNNALQSILFRNSWKTIEKIVAAAIRLETEHHFPDLGSPPSVATIVGSPRKGTAMAI